MTHKLESIDHIPHILHALAPIYISVRDSYMRVFTSMFTPKELCIEYIVVFPVILRDSFICSDIYGGMLPITCFPFDKNAVSDESMKK